MLHIQLMHDFWETVDQVTMQSPVVSQIAARWLAAPVTIYSLRASANITAIVGTERKEQIVLRFNPVDGRPVERLRSELEVIRQLANRGIHTPLLLPSLIGNDIECVSTQLGDFYAVAFAVMPGEHFEFEQLTLKEFGEWGQALGQLHKASENLRIVHRPSWATHIQLVKEFMPQGEEWLWRELLVIEALLAQLEMNEAGFGLIHYDFELDNILWHQGKPGILDFDDSGYYWFVADMATALRDLFDDRIDRINFQDERFRTFVEGYRSLRPMGTEELKTIPLFLRLHNLVTYARVYRAISDPIQAEPQWLKALRQKLQGKLAQYQQNVDIYPIGPFYENWTKGMM
jgi:Ser/Thr protein kinase RdoA (MazF antagonist)